MVREKRVEPVKEEEGDVCRVYRGRGQKAKGRTQYSAPRVIAAI